MVTVLALVLVGLLATFVFGGIILRTIGWFLILAGLIAGATTGNLWALILPLAAGARCYGSPGNTTSRCATTATAQRSPRRSSVGFPPGSNRRITGRPSRKAEPTIPSPESDLVLVTSVVTNQRISASALCPT